MARRREKKGQEPAVSSIVEAFAVADAETAPETASADAPAVEDVAAASATDAGSDATPADEVPPADVGPADAASADAGALGAEAALADEGSAVAVGAGDDLSGGDDSDLELEEPTRAVIVERTQDLSGLTDDADDAGLAADADLPTDTEGAAGIAAGEPGDRVSPEDAAVPPEADLTTGAGDEAELPQRTAELKSIVEALIFASPEPLTLKALTKLLDGEPKDDIAAALDALKADYERPTGLQLVEVAGGFQIVTRPDLHEWVRRLFHERSTQKLSVQALETLAVVAYRQPVTALEITEIRGVNTSGVMNTLLERHLIKIVGRKQVVGRPFMYATTKEFLIRFGLKDISDLPKVEDMAEALGIENPLLLERSPAEEQLPLGEPDEGMGDTADGVEEGATADSHEEPDVPALDEQTDPDESVH